MKFQNPTTTWTDILLLGTVGACCLTGLAAMALGAGPKAVAVIFGVGIASYFGWMLKKSV